MATKRITDVVTLQGRPAGHLSDQQFLEAALVLRVIMQTHLRAFAEPARERERVK